MKTKPLALVLIAIVVFACIGVGSTHPIKHRYGCGMGLPYGAMGFNYDMGINDYLSPTCGIGLVSEGVGWNIGARLYYPGPNNRVRGRITALYGTNMLLEDRHTGEDSQYSTELGFSVGVGTVIRLGPSWSLELDLFYINAEIPVGYEEGGTDLAYSFGFSTRI